MLVLIFSGLVTICLGQIAPPTSTANCYYTLVIPRDHIGNIDGQSSEIKQLQSEITDLRISLANILQQIGEGGQSGYSRPKGANFIRWGRTVCPTNTTVIYKGYGAKTQLGETGGGVDYQCLAESPEWTGNEVAGLQENTYIHGAQYWANGVPDILADGDKYSDMPCVACDAFTVSQTLMIPAKINCLDGWTKMYQGNLMAERTQPHHKSGSNYICVDKDYETVVGSVAGEVSGYAIPVEVVCSAIPCAPYVNGYELSCVVCAK